MGSSNLAWAPCLLKYRKSNIHHTKTYNFFSCPTLQVSMLPMRMVHISLSFFKLEDNCFIGASLVAQMVKNLLAIQETQVQSLGQEDPLGEEMATHSSILAWKIPRTEEPGGLQSCL